MDPAITPSSSTGGSAMKLKQQEEEEEMMTAGRVTMKLQQEEEEEEMMTAGRVTMKLQQEEEIVTRETTIPRQQPNLPRADLIGHRDGFINICVPLHNASMRGDWEAAKRILDIYQPEPIRLVGYAITENYDTALHIAASTKSNKLVERFVQNLVRRMTAKDLELENKSHNTAFCLAAAAGNLTIARILIDYHPGLVNIPGSQEMMPLYMAALFGHREMVEFLFQISDMRDSDFWTNENRGWVFQRCVEDDFFDIALTMVAIWQQLAKSGIVLGILARKTDAFRVIKPHFGWRIINQIFAPLHVKIGPGDKPSDAMKLLRTMWTYILKLPNAEIDEILRGPGETQDGMQNHSSRVLFVAAEMGNTEFVVELVRRYPDLIWKTNDNNQTIFHVAVSHRHEDIYNLLHEVGSMKDTITPLKDKDGNNMLHLVGKCAKKKRLGDVSGYALQMQRELLWFKEVEATVPPTYRERKNKDGLTPHELFTMEHKDLVSAGEKWMKDTASQCMVVAALIATIVFAAAFTIPGGYDQTSGLPTFLNRKSFIVFVISDAISLTFASISILIFLSILTSRYAEQDFLEKLPKRLMRGLTTLFFSIATMMVAFSISFFVLYQDNFIWVPIAISIFASMPVILYARLQYDLLGDVYHSTYGSKNLFKPVELKLYVQNPPY